MVRCKVGWLSGILECACKLGRMSGARTLLTSAPVINIEIQTVDTRGASMELSIKVRRKFLVIGATFAISAQSTLALAGCMEDEIADAFAAQKTVEICITERCGEAELTRLCTNILDSSVDYEMNTDRWQFRIKFHGDGVEDDEYSVTLNGTELSKVEVQQLTCQPISSDEGCEIINGVLNRILEG